MTLLFAPVLFLFGLFGIGDDDDDGRSAAGVAVFALVSIIVVFYGLERLTVSGFFKDIGATIAGVLRAWGELVSSVLAPVLGLVGLA